MQRYLVVYDIENDRVRSRVASALQRVGVRVQKSVFECLLEPSALERLERRLGRLVETDDGADIRIYRLCASCYAASFGLGEVDAGTGGEPWVVI